MTILVILASVALSLIFFIGHVGCVMFAEGSDVEDDHKTLTVSSAVKSCLAGIDPIVPCLNERAMAALEQSETMDVVRLDSGFEITRKPDGDESFFAPREVYSFGDNPYNIGALIQAASSLLSRRMFCLDINMLYPGLQMRIGPTYNGKGIIDFIINPRQKFDERSLGYGQLIFKRSFLPNVLATQISIASVIPLIFAVLYFLTKKAFLLSKFALIVTSIMGYGSLFLHHGSKPFGHSFGNHQPLSGFQQFSGHHPVGGNHPINDHRHPIGGTYNAFIGDIRGDKFYNNYDGFQQISSSKPSSLFRGVNYFPQEYQTTTYTDLIDKNKKEIE